MLLVSRWCCVRLGQALYCSLWHSFQPPVSSLTHSELS
jgi:hypothetical protein